MQATTIKATDILRNEHAIILDVLSALESISRSVSDGARLDLESARESLDFLRNFVDRCHHGKEEQHFFPALAERGLPVEVGPLAVMTSEHGVGRTVLARMASAVSRAERAELGASTEFATAAAAYVGLMRDHIAKENEVLFPMGDGMLPEAQQAALLRGFETFEHDDMGAGAHERFIDIASRLCKRWNVERGASSISVGHSCCGHGRK